MTQNMPQSHPPEGTRESVRESASVRVPHDSRSLSAASLPSVHPCFRKRTQPYALG
jgi:hypothetical protein